MWAEVGWHVDYAVLVVFASEGRSVLGGVCRFCFLGEGIWCGGQLVMLRIFLPLPRLCSSSHPLRCLDGQLVEGSLRAMGS